MQPICRGGKGLHVGTLRLSSKHQMLSTQSEALCQPSASGAQGFWSQSDLGSNPELDTFQLCGFGQTFHALCAAVVPSTK